MILAADIGGTKSLFALLEMTGSYLHVVYLKRYPSKNFTSLEGAIQAFFADYTASFCCEPNIDAACFGLAATITDEGFYLVNLGWEVETASLKNAFPQISQLHICNDLEATGYGLELLPSTDLHRLTAKRKDISSELSAKKDTRRGIIAPGTGLGEAFLLGSKVIASEGAHCEFGPRSEFEVQLWSFLHEKFDHVSYERIVSGPGLSHLEQFVRKAVIGEESSSPLLPEDITRLALGGKCPICQQALDHFVNILGAEAGNLALKFLAVDGIYLAGGIPPKILSKLQDGAFLDSFCAKGRFSDLMKSIPVFVNLNSHTALYGAASLAAQAIHPGIKPIMIADYQ